MTATLQYPDIPRWKPFSPVTIPTIPRRSQQGPLNRMHLKRDLMLLTLALTLTLSGKVRAAVPTGSNAGQIPDITVWDEANHQSTMWEKLRTAGSGPVIVLPVYTRCTMSCPVTARMLVKETAQIGGGKPYRVLIFSFDPGDDTAALRQFRVLEGLPPAWILVRSDAADIRQFCDFFHFPVLTEGPVMIHNNQVFLLDHSLQWRATFIDKDWDGAELRKWMGRVETPGLLGWLAMNPESLAFVGSGGMLLSLALIVGVTLSRSHHQSA
jgi:cytochrome oxidase Cu insertion factor (SCO1/SenC/PrrC family)